MSLFKELKRRNVFRVGIAYLVLGWLLLQVTDVVVPILELPTWAAKLVLFLLLIGLPVVLLFAWAFELTPEGLKREKDVDRSKSITPQTGKKLDRVIIGVLAVAVALLLADRFWLSAPVESGGPPPVAGAGQATALSSTAEERSVAVLPFLALSSGPDDEYFADGLTEEILNSLAQLPELLVTARTSAFSFKGRDLPIAEIATALGVQHVVEGSVRKAGDRLRVTAQLIRADDGFHLWSQNYDRNSADTIAVQEDIAEQIATSLDVVLDDGRRDAMRRAGLRDVTAFVEYQKALEFYARAHGEQEQIENLRRANEHFENVLARVPNYGPAYVDHSDLYIHQLDNDATADPETRMLDVEAQGLLQHAIDDYSAAVRFARSPEERHTWELDLAVISGNWRGLPGRLESVFNDSSCAWGNWLSPLAAVFGYADRYMRRADDMLACDPLFTIKWFNKSRAALWAGDPEAAIRFARHGQDVAPGEWLNIALIRALTANGEFDAAEDVIASQLQVGVDAIFSRDFLAAARGDAEEAARQFEILRQEQPVQDLFYFLHHTWIGDRETANRMAADIDQHPFRNLTLVLVTYWCACGAPFDLDATPNFAAKLEEADLPWPPVPVIHFPLKNW